MIDSEAHGGPLVTVITPSYNQGSFIGDCIASVGSQTYPRVEHLIYDACSTDETDDVVESLRSSYRFQYFREPDDGQANAINKGLDRARGEIVCWLNSDDMFYDEGVIEQVVGLFNSHPEADVVSGGGVYTDADGTVRGEIRASAHAGSLTRLRQTCWTLQPATFWRNNRIRLDESWQYVFDWKYFIDLLEAGKRFMIVDRKLARYRLQPESKTQTDPARRKKEVYKLVRQLRAHPPQVGWCGLIYKSYVLAERLRKPWIKTAATAANRLMRFATGGRINSS